MSSATTPAANDTDCPSDRTIVEARALRKRFGERTAVDGLDLDVRRGECYGLLGPNGAGKTTTLRMLYGVTTPTSGTVRVFGLDLATNRRAVRARLGVTLQENVLVEPLSAAENLAIFGRYHLLDETQIAQRVDELIEFLALESHRDVPIRELSGGFQRRVAIAQSLMNRPELLVLDEPTTGLDPAVRLALWSRIRELRSRGTTVLLTTHYMDEAERLCDRVGIIAAGRMLIQGSPRELIESKLARETLEIDCSPEEESALFGDDIPGSHRLRSGNRLMVQVDDAAALADRVRASDGPTHRPIVVRPTTLEDLFLALTGASLEGDA